jgi:hypothetical protein
MCGKDLGPDGRADLRRWGAGDGDDRWGARAVQACAELDDLVAAIDRLHAELPDR